MKSKLLCLGLVAAIAAAVHAFVFAPQTMTVVRGKVVSGNMGSLFNSDNDRLVVRNSVRVSAYDNPVDILAQVVCGQPNPLSMKLRLESSASTLGLVEYVEMFNWSLNRYEEVYRGNISQTEAGRIVTIPNGGRFTGSGGQMQVRYWVDARGPVTANSWTVSLDELTWDVEF